MDDVKSMVPWPALDLSVDAEDEEGRKDTHLLDLKPPNDIRDAAQMELTLRKVEWVVKHLVWFLKKQQALTGGPTKKLSCPPWVAKLPDRIRRMRPGAMTLTGHAQNDTPAVNIVCVHFTAFCLLITTCPMCPLQQRAAREVRNEIYDKFRHHWQAPGVSFNKLPDNVKVPSAY